MHYRPRHIIERTFHKCILTLKLHFNDDIFIAVDFAKNVIEYRPAIVMQRHKLLVEVTDGSNLLSTALKQCVEKRHQQLPVAKQQLEAVISEDVNILQRLVQVTVVF